LFECLAEDIFSWGRRTDDLESATGVPQSAMPSAPTAMTPRATTEPLFADENKPSAPLTDFERHADDIIANFKARQSSGMEQAKREMSRLLGEEA